MGSGIKRRMVNLVNAPSADHHYVRQSMDKAVLAELARLGPAELEAVEVSGGFREDLGWRSYTRLTYPAFDLTTPPLHLPGPFDVVICEQVLEHVSDPARAVATLRDLTRPGGHLLVSTPFLIRIHPEPSDYWRFTAAGLRLLLERAGLEVERVGSWGNRTAVITNLFGWTPAYRWLPRKPRAEFPLVVWAFASRPYGPRHGDRIESGDGRPSGPS